METLTLEKPDKWQEEIVKLIRLVVREELNSYEHTCRFSVDDDDVKEFGHFMGMMQDVGEGRIGKGVDVIRENHKWMAKQRERSDKLSAAFFIVIVTTITGGMLAALWHGIKLLIGKTGV